MSLLWLDGEVRFTYFTPFDVRDRGLALGDGLFETILVVNRVAIWQALHLDRLQWSAKALGITCDRARIEAAIIDVLAKSDAMPQVLRITLTRGLTARGLAGDGAVPTLLLQIDPYDTALIGQPAKLATSGIRRSASSPAANHKTLSYVDNIVAAREAKALNADDALMLNSADHVASTTIGNLFLLQGGKLVTPSLDQGILPGVTRAVVLKAAKEKGLETEERAVAPIELFASDACFLTNSLRLLRPLRSLDDRSLGKADVSGFLDALLDLAQAQCGTKLQTN